MKTAKPISEENKDDIFNYDPTFPESSYGAVGFKHIVSLIPPESKTIHILTNRADRGADNHKPNFVVGDYAPSKDWSAWSETPLE